MGDEAEIAVRTDRVARAMHIARNKLGQVVRGLGGPEFGQDLAQRTREIGALGGTRHRVADAEWQAGIAGQRARQSRSPEDMEAWNDADLDVRKTFQQSSAIAAGTAASGIGSTQRQLGAFRKDLSGVVEDLETAMEEVDALDRLPEFGKSEQTAALRAGLESLQKIARDADKGLKGAADQLDTGRRTALGLEQASLSVGDSNHSRAVGSATTSLEQTIDKTYDEVQEVRTELLKRGPEVGEITQGGIDTADAAREVNQAAEADLAKTFQAAANPTPRGAQQVASSGAQDLRLRLDGPSQDTEVRR